MDLGTLWVILCTQAKSHGTSMSALCPGYTSKLISDVVHRCCSLPIPKSRPDYELRSRQFYAFLTMIGAASYAFSMFQLSKSKKEILEVARQFTCRDFPKTEKEFRSQLKNGLLASSLSNRSTDRTVGRCDQTLGSVMAQALSVGQGVISLLNREYACILNNG